MGQKFIKNDYIIILNLAQLKLYSYYIIYMKAQKHPLSHHQKKKKKKKKTLAKHLISNGISYQESACRVVF